MFRPRSVLILAVSLLGLQNGAAQSSGGPQLLLQGRFAPGASSSGTASVPQTFSWPASSVITSFSGASTVTITLAALPPKGKLTYAINWFRFFLDNKPVGDGLTSYNKLNLTVTFNLTVTLPVTSDSHTLKITKMNEAGKGEAILQGISLNSGSFLPTSQTLSPKRILVLGDSYTSGFGNAAANDPAACAPTASNLKSDWLATCSALSVADAKECANFWGNLNENSLYAFAAVAANSLGADFQVIAESGAGLIGYAYASKVNPGQTLAQYQQEEPANDLMFNRSIYSSTDTPYNLTSWIPQVVVIASGSNDWNAPTNEYTVASWTSKAADFLQQISRTFNQPRIILQVFPDAQLGAMYISVMQSLYNETQRRQMSNVVLFQLKNVAANATNGWCTDHPSAAAHADFGAQLAAQISTLQNGWNIVNPVDLNPQQSELRPNTTLTTGVATTYDTVPSSPSGASSPSVTTFSQSGTTGATGSGSSPPATPVVTFVAG